MEWRAATSHFRLPDARDWSPWREEKVTRVTKVVVVEYLMSRCRCSTPISSASASMEDGRWRECVSCVPSYSRIRFFFSKMSGMILRIRLRSLPQGNTHLKTLLDNRHNRSWNKSLEQLANFLIWGARSIGPV